MSPAMTMPKPPTARSSKTRSAPSIAMRIAPRSTEEDAMKRRGRSLSAHRRGELIHLHGEAFLRQLVDEHAVHPRILVAVFDLIAALLHVDVDLGVDFSHLLGQRITHAALRERDIAHRN